MPDTFNKVQDKAPEFVSNTDIIDEMSPSAVSEMLDVLSDMVLVCVDGCIRHINTIGIQICGANRQEDLLGLDFAELINDDLTNSTDNFLATLTKKHTPIPISIKSLNGTASNLLITVNSLPDLGPNSYVVTAENITNEMNLSKAVQDSEDRFGKLVDNALDFICVSKDGIITYINQAGMNMLKATNGENIVGKSLNEFLHPDYKGVLDGALAELAQDGELLPLRFVDISQTPIDVELGIIALEDGDSHRYMIEARDITAHNRAVTALRSSIENLEQRVNERTQELSAEIVERRRAEEMLRHIASHDGLTDLPNRSLLMDRLNQAVHRTHRDGNKCAVLFIDLDGFKPINDTLGHDMGDFVLQEVSKRLTKSVRETDTASRFGGDEFVLVLADIEQTKDAVFVAEKVLSKLKKPFDLDERKAYVGASIGIAIYPDDGDSAENILKQADEAMYTVKERGKNGYFLASENT